MRTKRTKDQLEHEIEFYHGIACRIRATRVKRGLSQAQLAGAIGQRPMIVTHIENHRRRPTAYVLGSIAWVLAWGGSRWLWKWSR